MVLVRQAVRVSGISALAITKLDVLTGLDKLKICVGYKSADGEFTHAVPASMNILSECQPVYEEFDGWKENILHAQGNERTARQCPKVSEAAGRIGRS